jgi:hypothetical protein
MSYFNLGPHVPTANTCQNCDKHLRVVHSGTPRCDRCLPDDVSQLKTCACHLARYCVSNLPYSRSFSPLISGPRTPGARKITGKPIGPIARTPHKASSFHVCLARPRKHGTLASWSGAIILANNSLPLLCGPWGRVPTPIEQVSKLYRPETHSIIAPNFRNAPLRHLRRCGGDDIYSWKNLFQTSGQNRQMCLGSRSDAGVCS